MSHTRSLPVLEPEAGAPRCPPPTERPLTAAEAEKTAAIFKALGDPVRLRLFPLIAAHAGGGSSRPCRPRWGARSPRSPEDRP